MEESLHAKIQSRKRKGAPLSSSNSKLLVGILTRSKSRMYCHQNRSGASRPDPVRRKAVMLRPKIESMEALPEANRGNASRVSSIKDLRMRRVFTPDVISVPLKEEEENGDEKQLKVSDGAPVSYPVLYCDPKVDELEKPGTIQLEARGERNDVENGLSFEDCSGNNSVSESKMALNRCGRRKVFRDPSSFSYRRLLPYLTDILNDDSSVPKIEIVDAEVPCKLQKLDDANHNASSVVESSFTVNLNHFGDASSSENGEVQKLNQNVPFNQQKLSAAENKLGQTEDIKKSVQVEQKCNENGKYRDNASVEEECCQMTPPDPDVISKSELGRGRNSMEGTNVQTENQDSKSQLIGGECSNVDRRQSPEGKPDADSICRSVLNPCSQLRLFKNMGSLSYRRMLPFLMDMSKSNTSASRIIQKPEPQVDSKENLHPVSSTATEQNYANLKEKQCTETVMQNSLSMVSVHSSNDSSLPSLLNNYSSNAELCSVTVETAVDSHELKDHLAEVMSQPQSTPRKLEPVFDWDNNSALPTSSPDEIDILNKQSTSEEPETVAEQMQRCVGLKHQNSHKDLVQKVNLNQSSLLSEASNDLAAPISSSFKGILKKNRLGCRGLCNCLNCSSFRLHAEKAFEFSRNQMHDVEEVALELMKELASLRMLLEKSDIDADDVSANQLNPVGVKAACDRALETEKFAKERLSQLNYDLNIHCRIPALLQPRVTFANYIHERAIPEGDISTSMGKER